MIVSLNEKKCISFHDFSQILVFLIVGLVVSFKKNMGVGLLIILSGQKLPDFNTKTINQHSKLRLYRPNNNICKLKMKTS